MTAPSTPPDPTDFSFELPLELIAQEPLPDRAASRLLVVPAAGENYRELRFREVASLLQPGDLLVLNDTRVVPGRLYGRKASGGQVEMLLERFEAPDRALVQLRSSRSPRAGARLHFDGGLDATVSDRVGPFFRLHFDAPLEPVLQAHGHVPLPPYIERADAPADRERYQTVYAAKPGAVAAPTAGLHFDAELLENLREQGVEIASITLHVGAGTFLPLRDEQLQSGRLHAEYIEVSVSLVDAIQRVHERGGRVVAVGTTVMRALESAALDGELRAYAGETDIFIWPGFDFKVVDALITNFHLPESSLLMLVSAFSGREVILDAYRHAVRERFRFFSYGDAMFLERA